MIISTTNFSTTYASDICLKTGSTLLQASFYTAFAIVNLCRPVIYSVMRDLKIPCKYL